MIILYKKLAFPSVILSVSISGMNIIAEFQCTLPSYEPICTPPPAYFDWSRCSSQLAFRQSPGNDICGQYFSHYFPFFSPSSTFLIEGVLKSQNIFSKSGFEPLPQDVKLACTSALTTQPNWTFNIQKYNLTRSFIWYFCFAF